MKLYMGVTPDKYELPLFVADSLKELSKMSGIKVTRLEEEADYAII